MPQQPQTDWFTQHAPPAAAASDWFAANADAAPAQPGALERFAASAYQATPVPLAIGAARRVAQAIRQRSVQPIVSGAEAVARGFMPTPAHPDALGNLLGAQTADLAAQQVQHGDIAGAFGTAAGTAASLTSPELLKSAGGVAEDTAAGVFRRSATIPESAAKKTLTFKRSGGDIQAGINEIVRTQLAEGRGAPTSENLAGVRGDIGAAQAAANAKIDASSATIPKATILNAVDNLITDAWNNPARSSEVEQLRTLRHQYFDQLPDQVPVAQARAMVADANQMPYPTTDVGQVQRRVVQSVASALRPAINEAVPGVAEDYGRMAQLVPLKQALPKEIRASAQAPFIRRPSIRVVLAGAGGGELSYLTGHSPALGLAAGLAEHIAETPAIMQRLAQAGYTGGANTAALATWLAAHPEYSRLVPLVAAQKSLNLSDPTANLGGS
jgi:hypothetical protein